MRFIIFFLILFIQFSCSKEEIDEVLVEEYPICKSVIAHRGFWKKASNTDNCIQGLREAVFAKIYGVELDVSCSKDDSLIVAHGTKLGDYTISETNYEELRTVKLSNGELAPTLREYLQEVRSLSPDLMLFIELKNALSKPIYETVKSLNLPNPIIYISFHLKKLKELKDMDKSIKVLYLAGNKTPKELFDEGIDGINYSIKVIQDNPQWIDEAKSLNMITGSWVVNAKADIQWCGEKGLDYVTTDYPVEAVSLLTNP